MVIRVIGSFPSKLSNHKSSGFQKFRFSTIEELMMSSLREHTLLGLFGANHLGGGETPRYPDPPGGGDTPGYGPMVGGGETPG
jgi:hypothetical protein